MSDKIKTFWAEPSGYVNVSLRRFTYGRDLTCQKPVYTGAGHDASAVIHEQALECDWLEFDERGYYSVLGHADKNDERWPKVCATCGEPFDYADEFQINADRLYAGAPDDKLYTMRALPVGALYDATWLHGHMHGPGPDGIALMVVTPGGTWHVDGEANNCTRPQREQRVENGKAQTYLTERTHQCWVRHGDPRTGEVHVDKNGNTCAAGAGSIMMERWHGFLHNGYLVSA